MLRGWDALQQQGGPDWIGLWLVLQHFSGVLKKITFRDWSVFFWVLSSKGKKGGIFVAQVPGISRDLVATGRAGPRTQMLSLRSCSPSHLLAGLSWVSLFQVTVSPAARG